MLWLCIVLLSPSALAQFHPVPGDSLELSEIIFEGVEELDEDDIRDRLLTQASPSGFSIWLHNNLGSRAPFAAEPLFFDLDDFENDLDALRRHYNNNGFFHAVIEGSYSLAEDSSVHVRFIVDEGKASYIDSVDYTHIEKLPADVRDEILSDRVLLRGRRYRASNVQVERARILKILANSGYPTALSDSTVVTRKLSNNNVIIHLPFRFGRRLYFGKITEDIKGVDELNLVRKIVYDRLDFKEGEIYSTKELNEGETSLNRLGVFSYVRMMPDFAAAAAATDSLVPLTLELVPQRRYELAYGLLFSDQLQGFSMGAETSFLMRNVFAGAQSLTTRINVLGKIPEVNETYKAMIQVQFDQPYLFSNKSSGFISTSYNLVGEKDLATGDIFQITVGAQQFVTSQVTGKLDWTYEISQFNGDPMALLGAGLIYFDTTETINYRNSIRAVRVDWDLTDDLFNPKSGWFVSGIFEEAGYLEHIGLSPLPLADTARGVATAQYFKFEQLSKYFTDVSRNETMIFASKFRIGSIFRYDLTKKLNLPVPPNRRYYAGGPNSIRGWNVRELAVDTNAVNFGGNTLLETSVELRWQLFPNDPDWRRDIGVVFFLDAGNLWNELRLMRFDQIAVAMGVGLRYNMFFGPLRVDFGMKGHDPSLTENRWFTQKKWWSEVVSKGVVQFSIGHAF